MISFKPLTKIDYPLLQKWLNVEFVTHWYQRRKFIYDDVEKMFSGSRFYFTPVTSFIVEIDTIPIGYCQTYKLSDYPYFSKLLSVTDSQGGIDVFIGNTLYLRKGHGAPIIKEFVKKIVFTTPEISECIAGVNPKDAWTIRVYEKAGFVFFKQTEKEYFMSIKRSTGNVIFSSHSL